MTHHYIKLLIIYLVKKSIFIKKPMATKMIIICAIELTSFCTVEIGIAFVRRNSFLMFCWLKGASKQEQRLASSGQLANSIVVEPRLNEIP